MQKRIRYVYDRDAETAARTYSRTALRACNGEVAVMEECQESAKFSKSVSLSMHYFIVSLNFTPLARVSTIYRLGANLKNISPGLQSYRRVEERGRDARLKVSQCEKLVVARSYRQPLNYSRSITLKSQHGIV